MESLTISFPKASAAEANQFAGELADFLKDREPGLNVEQVRERADTQDFGATLVLVLRTASVTALAQGIAAWLKRSGTMLDIDNSGVKARKSNCVSFEGFRLAKSQGRTSRRCALSGVFISLLRCLGRQRSDTSGT
jgi:hypothetical protein